MQAFDLRDVRVIDLIENNMCINLIANITFAVQAQRGTLHSIYHSTWIKQI